MKNLVRSPAKAAVPCFELLSMPLVLALIMVIVMDSDVRSNTQAELNQQLS